MCFISLLFTELNSQGERLLNKHNLAKKIKAAIKNTMGDEIIQLQIADIFIQ